MAVESARKCGYRKIGGLYIVCDEMPVPCDRLPFELTVCPCCGEGIKPSRGVTWVEPTRMFGGIHGEACMCSEGCPICYPNYYFHDGDPDYYERPVLGKKALLLWIGKQHYPTVREFAQEGIEQGISRRIKTLPRGFKLGQTYVLLAHQEAVAREIENGTAGTDKNGKQDYIFKKEMKMFPGIFCGFLPKRLERIVKQSDYDVFEKYSKMTTDQVEADGQFGELEEEICSRLQADVDRGITLVPVPDNDKDHQ